MELPLPEMGKAAGRVGAEGRGNKDVGSWLSHARYTGEVLECRGGTGSAWPPQSSERGSDSRVHPTPNTGHCGIREAGSLARETCPWASVRL